MVDETKKCPFCAELIQYEAKKCKHCGETLDAVLRSAEETKRSQQSVNQTVVVNNDNHKRPFPHGWHLFGCLLTCGMWLPIWILHYLVRDRKLYY